MIGKTISHYKIIEKLGGGGMGVVYKAQDIKLKRTVALKFLPPDMTRDEEAKDRFMHEAQAASALEHSNICNVHEIDETDDGQMFIAMAYYDGETLKKKIERGPMPLEETIDIGIQIAQGLARAHEEDIIHRDIKPANVMITNRGDVKIVDFGLAKLSGRTQLTKEGTTLGTVAYMSPEQAQGAAVDHRTDIWALGVVLYEMITGRQPFEGDYEQAVTYSIMNEDVEPLTGLRTGVPMELERIVNKALAKSPDERYQHVNEMRVDMKTVGKEMQLSGRSATATSVPPKSGKPKKLGRMVIAATAVLLVVIFTGRYLFLKNSETIDSIAVLPLQNLSGDPEQEYFVDGMTEALIFELSKIKALRVISRTSIMQFKDSHKTLPEIASDLNVHAIVQGSVLRVEDKVRITVQLIQASPEQHLWAEEYKRDLKDILGLQEEVARAIVKEIKIAVTPKEEVRHTSARAVNTKAFQSYLKGRYHWNKRTSEGLIKAVDFFEKAIMEDKNYAQAYAGLADSYNLLPWFSDFPPKEAYPRAKVAAVKALELDSTLAEAHTSLAWSIMIYEWDWIGAEREFKQAIELNPNYATAHHWYAFFLVYNARFDEAIAEIKRAQEIDPLSLIINEDIGMLYYYARRYDEAIEALQRTIELDPNFSYTHFYLGWIYLQMSKYEEALIEFKKEKALSEGWNPFIETYIGVTYALTGATDEARQVLEYLMKTTKGTYTSPYLLAILYSALNEPDKSFEWLAKALEERHILLCFLKVDPAFDKLLSDPRFIALLKKMGFEK